MGADMKTPTQTDAFTVTATVDRIRFQRDGFVIFAITNKKTKQKMGAKGSVIGQTEEYVGQDVVFQGVVESTQYGDQINFDHCAIEEGVGYFWTHVSKIPKKSQQNIVTRFGVDPSWLSGERNEVIMKLATVPGIKGKTAVKLLDRWQDYQSIKQLMEIVSVYNIPQSQAVKIHRHFGDKAVGIITTTPYKLTEIHGIGFKKADEIARKIGIAEDDAGRFAAAVYFVMNEANAKGSTTIDEESFMDSLNDNLVMSDDRIAISSLEQLRSVVAQSESMNTNGVHYVDEAMLALDSSIAMDRYILRQLNFASTCRSLSLEVDEATNIINTRSDCKKLGDEQRAAVLSVLTSGAISAIQGYAGTGKTTTSKTLLNIIVDVFDLEHEDIIGCALAGVAANRIKTQSGYPAGTIHSVLGTSPDGGWLFNSDNPLPQKVVILDEAGMVDTYLFFSLLKAIDLTQTKLIILGDPAQLPPVGSGQPFLDLLDLQLVPSASLTKIYRQSDDKAIAVIAAEVRQGKRPAITKDYTDVFSYRVTGENSTEMNQMIEKHLLDIAAAYKSSSPPDIHNRQSVLDYLYTFQAITPRKSGVLGQEELSKRLRNIGLPFLNAETACKSVMPISMYEKVIHLKNENMKTTNGHDVRVYNGMIGMVISVDKEEDEFVVYYPLEGYTVKYTEKHVSSGVIGYAWALTIHKTQGSEYKHVAIPFSTSHWIMLNNKLAYTAITRAKESCHLIGSLKAFHHACTSIDATKRTTALQSIVKNAHTSN